MYSTAGVCMGWTLTDDDMSELLSERGEKKHGEDLTESRNNLV